MTKSCKKRNFSSINQLPCRLKWEEMEKGCCITGLPLGLGRFSLSTSPILSGALHFGCSLEKLLATNPYIRLPSSPSDMPTGICLIHSMMDPSEWKQHNSPIPIPRSSSSSFCSYFPSFRFSYERCRSCPYSLDVEQGQVFWFLLAE